MAIRNLFFTLNNQPYAIKDLEDPQLNLAFIEFYKIYFTTDREVSEAAIFNILPKVFSLSTNFFINHKSDIDFHDSYFENFTIFTESSWKRGFSEQASRVWDRVAHFISEFEKSNFRIHKGTLYYFWAVSLITNDKIDEALLALHKATSDDMKFRSKTWKTAPAYLFLTLNDQVPGPYFKEYIDYAAGFIRDRLSGDGNEKGKFKGYYQLTRNRKLTYEEFRSKFLDNPKISDDIKFFYTYSILRLWHLRKLHKRKLGEDVIAPLIFSSYIGSLTLIWENLLKFMFNNRSELGKNLPQLVKNIGLNPIKNLNQVNIERDKNFDVWLKKNLNKNIKKDLLIGYGLRNYSFHSLESEQALWENYADVLQSVMHCVFVTVENF